MEMEQVSLACCDSHCLKVRVCLVPVERYVCECVCLCVVCVFVCVCEVCAGGLAKDYVCVCVCVRV